MALRAAASAKATSAVRQSAIRPALRLSSSRASVVVRAQVNEAQVNKASQALAMSAAVGTLMSAGQVQAATELAQLAGSDNRPLILASLFVPVVGWVGFNILGGLFNQLNKMSEKKDEADPSIRVKRSVAGALGLGAAGLLASAPAEAATELAQLAGSDNRPLILASLFVPVVGWVGFNILGGLFNQLNKMSEKKDEADPSIRVKRSVAGALGLGAAGLLASAPAEAATELAQLAGSDNRPLILASLFVPVVGWVGFNILGGLFNQLNKMSEKKDEADPSIRVKRSVAGALGLGAAGLLASAPAEAATELAQLAGSDNRPLILASLFVPVVGWVGFNILGGLFNQLDKMSDKAAEADRSVVVKQKK